LRGVLIAKYHEIPLSKEGISMKDGKRIGVECKRMDAPRLTPSMRAAMQDLELSTLLVIYPGAKPYSLAENIKTVPLSILAEAWSLVLNELGEV